MEYFTNQAIVHYNQSSEKSNLLIADINLPVQIIKRAITTPSGITDSTGETNNNKIEHTESSDKYNYIIGNLSIRSYELSTNSYPKLVNTMYSLLFYYELLYPSIDLTILSYPVYITDTFVISYQVKNTGDILLTDIALTDYNLNTFLSTLSNVIVDVTIDDVTSTETLPELSLSDLMPQESQIITLTITSTGSHTDYEYITQSFTAGVRSLYCCYTLS